MGTLFSALDLGRAGLNVAQVQLDVTGNNIANVNKEGYSRQRVELTTRLPNYRSYGALGRGPGIEAITRMRDVFLDQVYRDQVPGLGRAQAEAGYYSQIENVFLEPGDNGFSTQLNVFFDAVSDFSNNVEEVSVREALLSEAASLASGLQDTTRRLSTLRTNANEEVRNLVTEINSLAERIAESNRAIFNAELSGQAANDLRDDRDVLLDELAGLVDISYRERDAGYVDVLIGGEEFVVGTKVRELEAAVAPELDENRPDLLEVRFADDGEAVTISDGELFGVLEIRDVELGALEDRMNEMAHALIQAFNSVQSQSRGIETYDTAMTSSIAASDPTAALDSAGFPFDVTDGSFDILVYDSSGNTVETITVSITAGSTTMNDIVAAVNASANMTASLDADGLLTVTPSAGQSFSFTNDSSNVLVAMGMNTLFTGSNAQDIAVNQALLDNPRLLGSSYSADALETGDNGAALEMAAIRYTNVLESDTQTVNEYYESMITEVGVNANANEQLLEVEEAFVNEFEARRQEVSGVNLDEEVTNLVMYQRAFEASARIITVADRMLETLVAMVG